MARPNTTIKMRSTLSLFVVSLICYVSCKNAPKSLTESLGQEVIEIGTPIKELPQGLDEEPSAENDDDDETNTTTVILPTPATKKDTNKTTLPESRRRLKDMEKLNRLQEEEEMRIEKELADIYKDSADYKAESSEESKELLKESKSVKNETKPLARSRTSFKFQPDLNDENDVERFRTSVDDIDCDRVTSLAVADKVSLKGKKKSAGDIMTSSDATVLLLAAIVSAFN